jgi:hypothetical protein
MFYNSLNCHVSFVKIDESEDSEDEDIKNDVEEEK